MVPSVLDRQLGRSRTGEKGFSYRFIFFVAEQSLLNSVFNEHKFEMAELCKGENLSTWIPQTSFCWRLFKRTSTNMLAVSARRTLKVIPEWK